MSLLHPRTVVSAHCDLPCGVYDPAQARYEAQSVKAMQEKYQSNEDPVYRTRCVIIIENRSQIAKPTTTPPRASPSGCSSCSATRQNTAGLGPNNASDNCSGVAFASSTARS